MNFVQFRAHHAKRGVHHFRPNHSNVVQIILPLHHLMRINIEQPWIQSSDAHISDGPVSEAVAKSPGEGDPAYKAPSFALSLD